MQLNEIFSTVLEEVGWDMSSYSTFTFSPNVNIRGSFFSQKMAGEDKKHIIFSWINTPFMSELLMSLQSQLSDIFDEADKDVIMVDSNQMFFKLLFLKSVYHYIPIRLILENNLPRYQVGFDDRAFWIVQEGTLGAPKGVYQ